MEYKKHGTQGVTPMGHLQLKKKVTHSEPIGFVQKKGKKKSRQKTEKMLCRAQKCSVHGSDGFKKQAAGPNTEKKERRMLGGGVKLVRGKGVGPGSGGPVTIPIEGKKKGKKEKTVHGRGTRFPKKTTEPEMN